MLKQLVEKIARPGVSDLHLKANEPPMIRIIGQMMPIGTNSFKAEDIESIAMSVMNEDQKAQLHEKMQIDFSVPMEGIGRLRINIYHQRNSLAMAIRIIPAEQKTFEQLFLPKDTLEKLCRSNRGLILVSGVTGAGKTTTLHALINHINENISNNIITLEDPIEFSHVRKKSSISQREIGRDVPNFSEGLRSALRQDPDIIVIGEMNSIETFQGAIECAASGHLVLATLQSNDSLDAVDRIVNAFDFQVQPNMRLQVTNVLTAIIGQRLIPDKNGRSCFPATEILLGSSQMKKLLLSNSPTEVKFLLEKSSAFGMHTFDQDLLRMFEAEIINSQDALMYSSNPQELRLKIQGTPGGPGPEPIK